MATTRVITASYLYRIAGLWVRHELRGTTIEVEHESRRCTVSIPATRDAFDFHAPAKLLAIRGGAGGFNIDDPEYVKVEVLCVTVDIESDVELWELGESPSEVQATEGLRVALKSEEVGNSFMTHLIRLLRVESGQFWLSSGSHEARPIPFPRYTTRDGQQMHIYALGQPRPITHVFDYEAVALDGDVLQKTCSRAADLSSASLPESLIADARYIVHSAEHRDYRQAVVFAAMACELAIKRDIEQAATPEQQALVGLVLSSPRDVSVSALSLFDKGLEAVCGRSFRVENKAAYKKLDALIQKRNALVHRRSLASAEDARAHVAAAVQAFQWLESLGDTGEG